MNKCLKDIKLIQHALVTEKTGENKMFSCKFNENNNDDINDSWQEGCMFHYITICYFPDNICF